MSYDMLIYSKKWDFLIFDDIDILAASSIHPTINCGIYKKGKYLNLDLVVIFDDCVLLWIFWKFFCLHSPNFHVCSFILIQVIMQNVSLSKSHFCKKWYFLSKFCHFCQIFSKISYIWFFGDSNLALHLCNKFWGFNINI